MRNKRGEILYKIFAIFAIYLLHASLISVNAIAVDPPIDDGTQTWDEMTPEEQFQQDPMKYAEENTDTLTPSQASTLTDD